MLVKRNLYIGVFAFLMVSLFTILSLPAKAAEGAWTTKSPMISERYGFQTVEVSGKIYAIGGIVGYPSLNYSLPVNTVEEYDPEADEWIPRASIPRIRYEASTVVANGKIYIIGGYSEKLNIGGGVYKNIYLSTMEEYDPVLNKWTTKASMYTPRARFNVGASNGKIYVFGGITNLNSISDYYTLSTEEYDIVLDKWTKKANMLEERSEAKVAVLDNKIYLIGGIGKIQLNPNSTTRGPLMTMDEYNSLTNAWSKKSKMLSIDNITGVTTANGKIYLFGGYSFFSPGVGARRIYNELEEYDPTKDKWTAKSGLPLDSYEHHISYIHVIKDKIYTIDYNGSRYVIQKYDPKVNGWERESDCILLNGTSFGTAVVNNKIYIIGDTKVEYIYPNYKWTYYKTVQEYTLSSEDDQDIPPLIKTIIVVPSPNNISLAWDSVAGATSYDIEVDSIKIESVTNPSYIHDSLEPGTWHTYRVRHRNNDVVGGWTTAIRIQTLVNKLTPPTNFKGVPTNTTVTLTWEPVINATGYDILVDNNSSYSTASTSFLHDNLLSETLHSYKVRAKNAYGVSEWSEILSVTTLPDPPATPLNLRGIATNMSVILSWDVVDKATTYDVEIDGSVTENVTNTGYLHNNLIPGTLHKYRVRARNSGGISEWTEPFYIRTILEIPINIKASSTYTDINIAWDNVYGATGYDMLIDGKEEYDVVSPYLYSNLSPGTEHTFRVRAKSAEVTSDWSQEFTQWTIPSIPINLKGTATNNSVTLIWDASIGTIEYNIEVNGMVKNSTTNTYYLDSELLPNTTYIYRVSAKNSGGISDWSAPISISTYLLATPTNIVLNITDKKITVSWDDVAGATGYDIEVDGTPRDNSTLTTFVHNPLLPSTQHTYRVRAKNENGTSAWSELVTAVTLLSAPSPIHAKAVGSTIEVTWNAVDGATSYEVIADNGEPKDNGASMIFIHKDLLPDTWHTYRVRAKNTLTASEWSKEISKKTKK